MWTLSLSLSLSLYLLFQFPPILKSVPKFVENCVVSMFDQVMLDQTYDHKESTYGPNQLQPLHET